MSGTCPDTGSLSFFYSKIFRAATNNQNSVCGDRALGSFKICLIVSVEVFSVLKQSNATLFASSKFSATAYVPGLRHESNMLLN